MTNQDFLKKGKLIQISDIPTRRRSANYNESYDQLFESIPKGQAMAFNITTTQRQCIYQALERRHKIGLYPNLRLKTRDGVVYIIHGSEAE